MAEDWIKGSCLCGTITYKVKELDGHAGNCHCSMCRKFHGAAFATYASAAAENFLWLSGEENLEIFTAPNGTTRKFCKSCGSSLIFEPSQPNEKIVEFSLATLDENSPVQPSAHIFTDYKAEWTSLDDDLPCYREGRNSERLK